MTKSVDRSSPLYDIIIIIDNKKLIVPFWKVYEPLIMVTQEKNEYEPIVLCL